MRDFLILFKQEFKDSFSFRRKGEKKDFVGRGLELLIILIIAAAFIFLSINVVETYVQVKIDNVLDIKSRAIELLNVCYLGLFIILVFMALSKYRKIIATKNDKEILLRLPIKSQVIFLSKFSVTYILCVLTAALVIIPINIIFGLVINPSYSFYLGMLIPILALPVMALFVATFLIIPYTIIINFFNNKHLFTLLFYVLLIGCGFYLYQLFLNLLKSLLETGNVKFLFDADFVNTLQNILKFGYPINIITNIVMVESLLSSYLILMAIIIAILAISYFLMKIMFYHTLYKNEVINDKVIRRKAKVHNPVISLIKKEFIIVFRTNTHLFSYFAIALSMPFITYGCFFIFRELLFNAIGLTVDFELALFVLLMFIVLTNTFCSTNITRDGNAFLKMKSFPLEAKKILAAKVLFCAIVSSIAVIATTITLFIVSEVSWLDFLFMTLIGLIFSISQILLGTRIDLNNAKLSASSYEIENESSKTIAKLVFIGLLFALFIGVLTIGMSLLLNTKLDLLILDLVIKLLIFGCTLLFGGLAIFFYYHNIEHQFYDVVL